MNATSFIHLTKKVIALLLPALLVVTLSRQVSAQTAPPQVIAYQGLLTDEVGTPAEGSRTFLFRFYDAATAGSQLGSDIVRSNVPVTEGVFSVNLDAAGIDFSRAVWLEVAASNASGDNPVVLLPRTQLTAVPYAFHAFNGGGSGGGWSLTGNAGLASGSNFLGTTDRTPLVFRVNNLPGFAIVPGGADGDRTPNVFGGVTFARPDLEGATVSGGGGNRVQGDYATVGGGHFNEARANYATIAGGGPVDLSDPTTNNVVFHEHGTIGGGGSNRVGSDANSLTHRFGTVSGGHGNYAGGAASAVGGGGRNIAEGDYATVSGGALNEARAAYATIAGGGPRDSKTFDEPNIVYDDYGTIGGGGGNRSGSNDSDPSGAQFATVGGGQSNRAGASYSTIAGGRSNFANAAYSTVAGGTNNAANTHYSTIGGGDGNHTGWTSDDPSNGTHATVAGGADNGAVGPMSTVSGGSSNRALGEDASIGGGTFNFAIGEGSTISGGASNQADGNYASVVGGGGNKAMGDYSLAGGRQAEALHQHSIVWSAGASQFSSTGENQFLVRAPGGVGIRTNTPRTQLHVTASRNGGATVTNHVALIENDASSTSVGPDVLALKTSAIGPSETTNFITFFDGNDAAVGAIEGTTSGGGVTLKSGGADFAELLPRLDPRESIAAGDVVGIFAGQVSKRTANADHVLVVSSRPIVLGNAVEGSMQDSHSAVAFTGQVDVRVIGPVVAGDLIVASGREDGTARALASGRYDFVDHGPAIGRAWASDRNEGEKLVNVAVGLDLTGAVLQRQHEFIKLLQTWLVLSQDALHVKDEMLQLHVERLDRQEALTDSLLREIGELRKRIDAASGATLVTTAGQ